MKVDHRAIFLEARTVGGPQHDAAARGQQYASELGQFHECCLFSITEAGLAFDFENRRDGHAEGAVPKLGIRVDEALAQASRELATQGGFPRTGQADQKQIAPAQRNRGRWWEADARVAGRRDHRTELTDSLTIRGVRKISSSVFVDDVPVCLNR